MRCLGWELPARNMEFPAKFIQLMILHRAYLTPHQLKMMYPTANDTCPRCQENDAHLVHMLWSCPRLTTYWSQIINILSTIIPGQTLDTLGTGLLGVSIHGKSGKPMVRFLNLMLILAKRTITRRWKAKKAPTVHEWYDEAIKWGGAEGSELHREEIRGLRKKHISMEWHILLEELKTIDIEQQE